MTMLPRTTALHRCAVRTVAGALLTAAVVGVSACGSASVLSLDVGQCINDKAIDEDEVTTVPVVDCAEPHTGEVYALYDLPAGDFPGAEAVQQSGQDLCQGQDFEDYVGLPYLESEVYFTFFHPGEEAWEEGDRDLICILTNEEGTETTGSLRDANR